MSDKTLFQTPWKCPKCGAGFDEHGKRPSEICDGEGKCQGLICECKNDTVAGDHGETFENPCSDANCYHCGWGGSLPKKPEGLLPWEKKALDAGWRPPVDWSKATKETP